MEARIETLTFPPTPTSTAPNSPRIAEPNDASNRTAIHLEALLPPLPDADADAFYRGYNQALQDMMQREFLQQQAYMQENYCSQTGEAPHIQQESEPHRATPPLPEAQENTPQRTRTFYLHRGIVTKLLTRLTGRVAHLDTQSSDEETKGQSRAKMDFKINIHLLNLFKEISPTLSLSLEDQDFPDALKKYKNSRIQSRRINHPHSADSDELKLLSELRERSNHMKRFLLPLMAQKNEYMFGRTYKQFITLNQFIKEIEKTGIPEGRETKIRECLEKIDEAKQEFMSKIAKPTPAPSWRDSISQGRYAPLTEVPDKDPQSTDPTATSSTSSTTADSRLPEHHAPTTEKVKALKESLSESRTHLVDLKSDLTLYMDHVTKQEKLNTLLPELKLSQVEEIIPSPMRVEVIDQYIKEIDDLNLQLQQHHKASQQGDPSAIKEVKRLTKAVAQLQTRLQQDINPVQTQLVEHHTHMQEYHETLFNEIAKRLGPPNRSKTPLEETTLKKYLSVIDLLTIPRDKKNKMKQHINRLLQPKLVMPEQHTDKQKKGQAFQMSQQGVFKAAFKGDLQKLHLVKITQDKINETSDDGSTLIHVAVIGNQLGTMDYLLKVDGIDVNRPNKNGDSPLISAIKRGYNEAAKRLIQNRADVTQTDRNGHTPLHHAVHSGNIEITESLLKHFPKEEIIPYPKLLEIATNNGDLEMTQFLLDLQKKQGTAPDIPYQNLLEIAINNEDLEMVRYLLSLQDEKDDNIPTMSALLENAIDKENTEIAQELLKAGADPNWVNTRKSTPLARAIIKKDEKMIALLLDNGGNPNQLIRNDQNLPIDTPLSIALRGPHSDKKKSIVLQLCLASANPDQRLRDRRDSLICTTPFHIAGYSNDEELLNILREFKPVTQKTSWRFGFSCARRSEGV